MHLPSAICVIVKRNVISPSICPNVLESKIANSLLHVDNGGRKHRYRICGNEEVGLKLEFFGKRSVGNEGQDSRFGWSHRCYRRKWWVQYWRVGDEWLRDGLTIGLLLRICCRSFGCGRRWPWCLDLCRFCDCSFRRLWQTFWLRIFESLLQQLPTLDSIRISLDLDIANPNSLIVCPKDGFLGSAVRSGNLIPFQMLVLVAKCGESKTASSFRMELVAAFCNCAIARENSCHMREVDKRIETSHQNLCRWTWTAGVAIMIVPPQHEWLVA